MLIFDDAYIERLNRRYGKGTFIKTIIFTEDPFAVPPVKRYWVDHQREITFQGNVYEKLHMKWENMRASGSLDMEGAQVHVSNLARKAEDYVETIDVKGHEIVPQILHLSLLTTLEKFWARRAQVVAVRATASTLTLTIGKESGKGDQLPPEVFLKETHPGMIDNPIGLL